MSLAAVFRSPEVVDLVNRPIAHIAYGDIEIGIEMCGVCGSDVVSYYEGHYVRPGQVMGHEFVGSVLRKGQLVEGVAIGDRVVVRPMRSCAQCWYCKRGDIHLCARTPTLSLSFGLDGGYAQTAVVPDAEVGVDILVLSAGVAAADALWTEPLAVALHAVARGEVRSGDDVLVVGAGSVGLCLTVAAALTGAHVTVVEPRRRRRDLAARNGADVVLADLHEAPGESFDVVLDSSGIPEAVTAALSKLRTIGVTVLVGVTPAELPLSRGREVRGAFGYTAQDFVRAFRLIDGGRVRLAEAVTHRFGLADLARAMHTVRHEAEAGKVVVVP